MQISEYIVERTGRSFDDLFMGGSPLVEITQHGEGFTVTHWDASLGQEPTAEELTAAVAAPPSQTRLVEYANAAQWDRATGGYMATIGGQQVPIATTETSYSLMSGKASRLAQPNPPATVSWQVGPTQFISIPASEFTALAVEVADFIQSTFDALPAVFAGISGGTITTTAEIDAVFAAI